MTFGEAINSMRDGFTVRRLGWNGKGMWIAIQIPDDSSKMTQPYIYMSTVQSSLIPWLASHADMLAEDWVIEEYLSDES